MRCVITVYTNENIRKDMSISGKWSKAPCILINTIYMEASCWCHVLAAFPWGKRPHTHWRGVWLNLKATLDMMMKRNLLAPHSRNWTPVETVASRFSDWTILANPLYRSEDFQIYDLHGENFIIDSISWFFPHTCYKAYDDSGHIKVWWIVKLVWMGKDATVTTWAFVWEK